MSEKDNQELRLTKQDLADLITAAVTAAKAPNTVEQKKLDQEQKQIEEDQKQRLAVSASVIEEMKQKRWTHLNHSHEHKNGASKCTFVQDKLGGFIICLGCQAKIRPDMPAAQRLDHDAIYDTAMFNKLFQKLPTSELFQ
jgi:hypothetical protein